MKKFSLGILIGIIILALGGTVVLGQSNSKNNKAQAPEITRGVFVDYGYSSPPWYPPSEETDTYRWAPRIYWAAGRLPLTVKVYTGAEPISGTLTAIEAGFTAWDNEIDTSLYSSISEATTTGPGVKLDGKNTVQWAEIDEPGEIIGATYYWYYTATKEMVEFDMILDKDEPWSTTGATSTFDVQNVVTHEAGHTLVLQDLRSPKDGALTMHAFTWLGDTIKRTLGLGDILGVQAIYGE